MPSAKRALERSRVLFQHNWTVSKQEFSIARVVKEER
jgi:hypothetical protein